MNSINGASQVYGRGSDIHRLRPHLLEQAEHLFEIPVIDVGQNVFFLRVELFAPPGPLRLPTLNPSAVDPDKTKISLFQGGRSFGLARYSFRGGP